MGIEKTVHRAGSLKQTNKAHKHGKHRSNRAIDQANKGKVSIKTMSIKNQREMRREERRHQANQIRKKKREEAIALKRSIGGTNTAPFLTCILSLHASIDPFSALAILETCDSEAVVTKTSTAVHITLPRLKQRFSFIAAPIVIGDEFKALDYLKVCDSTILLVSAAFGEENVLDKWGQRILNMASAQGIPTPIVTLMDLESIGPKKRHQAKVDIQKVIGKVLPNEKVMCLGSDADGLNMFRRIGGQKRNAVHNKNNRPHLCGERVDFVADSNSSAGTLKVTGFLRGIPLSVNGLVHIPGLGDFQLSQIDAQLDPYKTDRKSKDEKARILAVADPSQQTSLQRENIPDVMDAEQTWPTEEEIAQSKEENKKTRLIKRIPKGMSEYQAAWIPDIEEVSESDSDSDSEDEKDESFMSCASEPESCDEKEKNPEEAVESENEEEYDVVSVSEAAAPNDEVYDKGMDWDEDKQTLEKIKTATVEKQYPDEIDTPAEIPARTRFQKYRGLESFRTSPWDSKENLPFDYARIFQFENFDRTKKRVLKESKDVDGALPGSYITVHVAKVEKTLWEMYKSAQGDNFPVIVYGLLMHEHQMSVMNVVLRRTPDSQIPIKSKERLIMQCGYRRFIVNPIYSQHTNGDKHKYERFFQPNENVVASFFAPVQFPPAPVLAFRENPNTTLSMIATGHVIACNPDRVVLKRVVLSGHPFKIHRKTATIRYMFFNKEDVNFFKPCKLRTKCGRLGHIKESLGTHGHMKCVFDGPLKSFDTVFLHLYKRVYPKWTYEDCVVHCPKELEPEKKIEEDAKMAE